MIEVIPDKIKIIDFFGSWCHPCKQMNPILEEFSQENPNVEIEKIDVDNDPQNLATSYNIKSIPTFIFLKNDKVLLKHSGTISKAKLNEIVKWIENENEL